jgi:phosphatidate cytidylyltransferase
MADDDRSGGSGGFDDWLDEEPGPDTDPYAALSADDDADSEIAEWMAFTQGPTDGAVADDSAGGGDDSESTDEATTGALDADAAPAAREVDAVVEADVTEEIELPSAPVTPASATPASDASASEDGGGDDGDEGAGTGADTAIEHVDTEEIDVEMLDGDEVDPLDRAARIPIIRPAEARPATTVDLDEFDGGGRADTDEVPIVAGADVVAASVVNLNDPTRAAGPDAPNEDVTRADTTRADDRDEAPSGKPDVRDADELDAPVFDDAGAEASPPKGSPEPELAAVADVPDDDTGELDAVEVDDEDGVIGDDEALGAFTFDAPGSSSGQPRVPGDDGPELFDLTQEDYLSGATRDHAGLAAAIAEADAEDTEQVALAAPIAGLESTVVGFDDVVQAEGHGRVRARASGDLVARIITALVLIGALAASLVWKPALVALATVVFIIGAGEFYTALTRAGRHPIALFGFVGILGATLGAFAWGPIAIPTAFFLVATVLLLFYAVVPGRADPMGNLALTITVMVWVGLGAYAMPIAVSDDYRPLIIGVVVSVAAMDIAQYFVGRSLGRHQLSPWVSPKKTVEGLVGGIIVALGIGALLHFFPPFELTSGLAIGAAVAILVPLGDLSMSAAKRALGIKDMGSVLPGHGGFLDRIDGLLFVIPAAWAIFVWVGLL